MKENLRKLFRENWWILGLCFGLILHFFTNQFAVGIYKNILTEANGQISFFIMSILLFLGYELSFTRVFFPENRRINLLLVCNIFFVSCALDFCFRVLPHISHINGVINYFNTNGFALSKNIFVEPILNVHSILAIFVAPILEEFVFRYNMYYGMKKRYESILIAMIITSIIFALIHYDKIRGIEDFLIVFTDGLWLAYIYEKTGNILSSIILHAIHNIYANVVNSMLYGYAIFFRILFAGIGVIVLVVSLIVFLVKKRNAKIAVVAEESALGAESTMVQSPEVEI